jgi:hypothetical protein
MQTIKIPVLPEELEKDTIYLVGEKPPYDIFITTNEEHPVIRDNPFLKLIETQPPYQNDIDIVFINVGDDRFNIAYNLETEERCILDTTQVSLESFIISTHLL